MCLSGQAALALGNMPKCAPPSIAKYQKAIFESFPCCFPVRSAVNVVDILHSSPRRLGSSFGTQSTINARSETAATKPAFRESLKSRRCLIPADGFYEWRRAGKTKQPFCFEVNDGELFAFAGLWDGWKDPSGNWIKTCSILTTTPNASTAAVHDRMPVILDPDNYDLRLDPGMRDAGAASDLLRPCDAQLMRRYPVSTRINHVANDDEERSAPAELEQIQNRLFL